MAIGGVLFRLARWKKPPALMLRGKMIIGGLMLTAPPVLAMLIFGYAQSRLMNEAALLASESRLDQRLQEIETAFVDAMFGLQTSLRQLTREPFMIRGDDESQIKAYLQKLIPWMGFRYYFYHRSGRHFSFAPNTDDPARNEHLRYISTLLKSAKFDFPLDKISHAGAGALTNIMSGFEMPESKWEDVVGRLAPSEVGDSDWFAFPAFVYDHAGTKAAFLFFSLQRRLMRDDFLRRQAERPITDVECLIDGHSQLGPAHRLLLDRATSSGRTQFGEFRIQGERWQLLARPLRGLGVSAVAAVKIEKAALIDPYHGLQILGLAAMLVVSLGVMLFLRWSMYEPVTRIRESISRIEAGEYGSLPEAHTADELEELAQAVGDLGRGLEQKARLQSFVRPDLVASLTESRSAVARVSVAVLFAGLRDFSHLETALTPEQALETMGQFLSRVETAVDRNGGQIDKFIGDTAMALFLPAQDHEAGEVRVRRAAVQIDAAMNLWNEERQSVGLPRLCFGVGLASGETLTGSIGSRRRRLDFTAIGDVVNLSARLEKLAGRANGPSIMGTGVVCQQTEPGWFWVSTGIQEVRGRTGKTPVFGLIREDRCS
ncbi:MAG TPA: adenylate/guanylate cyclase domain-containing protein, partial [Candidatus Ozemobacteraceae bacterium]|nr:adenylate/guanylate cyclase domain-containing protein [Candidatus Ozemobacteraceae bacterium]